MSALSLAKREAETQTEDVEIRDDRDDFHNQSHLLSEIRKADDEDSHNVSQTDFENQVAQFKTSTLSKEELVDSEPELGSGDTLQSV